METKLLRAAEAKELAIKGQAENIGRAIAQIIGACQMGYEEVLLFGIWLDMEGVKKLMDLGYAVSVIDHPFEQRKAYKVSW